MTLKTLEKIKNIMSLITSFCVIEQADINKPYKIYDMTRSVGNTLKKYYPTLSVETHRLENIKSILSQNSNTSPGTAKDNSGKFFILLNESSLLFSNTISAESNVRKWLMDNDYIDGIIQLPKNEFINKGITTYLLCLSKNKPTDRKDKIICINAEAIYDSMTNSANNNSNQLKEQTIEDIIRIYNDFLETENSKVLSKYHFYFNQQSFLKLKVDNKFGAYNNGVLQKPLDSDYVCNLYLTDRKKEQYIEEIRVKNYDLTQEDIPIVNKLFRNFDLNEKNITVTTDYDELFTIDTNNCILKQHIDEQKPKNLGYGEITVKATYKQNRVVLKIAINPIWIKTTEKIGYSPNEKENYKIIQYFMNKWVSENDTQYQLLDNNIGVEVNFNKVFSQKI